ncbi:hypothetical protein DL96DRAFT_1715622 [Flagelloscypha sp. PMI_526]|nr:hypothetical protein DL96DRAFT_1715622 [Flagelloscypha sp. PMI_526]
MPPFLPPFWSPLVTMSSINGPDKSTNTEIDDKQVDRLRSTFDNLLADAEQYVKEVLEINGHRLAISSVTELSLASKYSRHEVFATQVKKSDILLSNTTSFSGSLQADVCTLLRRLRNLSELRLDLPSCLGGYELRTIVLSIHSNQLETISSTTLYCHHITTLLRKHRTLRKVIVTRCQRHCRQLHGIPAQRLEVAGAPPKCLHHLLLHTPPPPHSLTGNLSIQLPLQPLSIQSSSDIRWFSDLPAPQRLLIQEINLTFIDDDDLFLSRIARTFPKLERLFITHIPGDSWYELQHNMPLKMWSGLAAMRFLQVLAFRTPLDIIPEFFDDYWTRKRVGDMLSTWFNEVHSVYEVRLCYGSMNTVSVWSHVGGLWIESHPRINYPGKGEVTENAIHRVLGFPRI